LIRILGNEVPLSFEVSEKVPRVKDPLFHRIYFAKAGGLFLIRSDESASTLHARPAKVKDIESIREYPYNYARLTVVVKENWWNPQSPLSLIYASQGHSMSILNWSWS